MFGKSKAMKKQVILGMVTLGLAACDPGPEPVDNNTLEAFSDDVNGINVNDAVNAIYGVGTAGVDFGADGTIDLTLTGMQAFGAVELDADTLCEEAGIDRTFAQLQEITLPFMVFFEDVDGDSRGTTSVDFDAPGGISITGLGPGSRRSVNLGIFARREGKLVVDASNAQDGTMNIVNFGETLTANGAETMVFDFSEVDNDPVAGQVIDINADISLNFKNAKFCQPLSDILNTTIVIP
jgi:hypothetical protein